MRWSTIGEGGREKKKKESKEDYCRSKVGRNARVKDGDRFIILGEGVGKWDGISETFVCWRRKEEEERRGGR